MVPAADHIRYKFQQTFLPKLIQIIETNAELQVLFPWVYAY